MLSLAIDYDAIRIAMFSALRVGTGLDTNHLVAMEPEVAGAPRPSLPYMGLKVTSAAQRTGDDAVSQVRTGRDGSALVRYTGNRSMVVSFHAFGTSHEQAYGMMALWQATLQTAGVQGLLRLQDVAVLSVGDVRDLSVLLATAYEGRSQMDVTFGILSRVEMWVPSIRVASAQGTADADRENQEFTVTVSTGE